MIAPGAKNPLPQDIRVLVGSILLLVAAGLLWTTGQQTPAIVLAVLVVANTVLLFLLPE